MKKILTWVKTICSKFSIWTIKSRFAERKWSEKAPCNYAPPPKKKAPLQVHLESLNHSHSFSLANFHKWSKFHQNRMAFNFIWGFLPSELPYGGAAREMKPFPLFLSSKFTSLVQISPKSDVFEFWRWGAGAVTPIAPLHRLLEIFDNFHRFSRANLHIWSKFHQNQMYFNF